MLKWSEPKQKKGILDKVISLNQLVNFLQFFNFKEFPSLHGHLFLVNLKVPKTAFVGLNFLARFLRF